MKRQFSVILKKYKIAFFMVHLLPTGIFYRRNQILFRKKRKKIFFLSQRLPQLLRLAKKFMLKSGQSIFLFRFAPINMLKPT
jgi:hypothetical protein